MGLFGKEKLREIEAAGQFVMMVTKGVQQHWPVLANELKGMFQTENSMSDDKYDSFEFVLAVIACQIQALPNLLSADQASRIRENVMQCISSPDLGEYPREAVQEYQNAWDQSLQQSEPPFFGIASVLFDKLGCILQGSPYSDGIRREDRNFRRSMVENCDTKVQAGALTPTKKSSKFTNRK